MRTLLAGLSIVTAAALLGGCAGGAIGGSALPNAGMAQIHNSSELGGGPSVGHKGMGVGGGPSVASRNRGLGEAGGGPSVAGRHMRQLGELGGGPSVGHGR